MIYIYYVTKYCKFCMSHKNNKSRQSLMHDSKVFHLLDSRTPEDILYK